MRNKHLSRDMIDIGGRTGRRRRDTKVYAEK